ncbi:glycosyltransferase family 4 protein [Sphingomonas nostoxanthinifaciens]|uniref:glycosyltransferase family 4 protein n=1 Tax=Sphingomonas nostoxanthinifaciens TaxID=2872652 RepID=UPI001CC1D821|nr:glycosyltransferase family 4 protein [Sphingomonas nostoxanthinifaciens]UAK23358.1 glycosyltransferase family 4 protein [Sphingomonas nostoxanthinifaciens]
MHIAYLTNQYPAVSHSFIRREIAAMEALGHRIDRYSVRGPGGGLGAEDQAEVARTTPILAQGAAALLRAMLAELVTRPATWFAALRLTLGMHKAAGRGLVPHLAYLAEACWLARALRASGAEHVHVHFGTNPAAVARIARRLGAPPYSFTVHGPDEFDRPQELDLAGKVADAKAAVAISSYGRGQLMRWSALADWPKIGVARCGIDASFREVDDVPSAPGIPGFVAVARLAPQKGLPLLIEAAGRLARDGRDFTLTLVGDGPLRAELTAQAARLGLSDRVVFAGICDGAGVRRHLLAARAFVLPSFAEGLPVVIMEALALRRPVVVSAIAGTPELVDHECGWLVPAGSVEALADAMAAVLDADPAQLAAMGEEGRARVLAQHDAAANARALTALIAA